MRRRVPRVLAPGFTFDGQQIPILPGDTLGSAMHRAGVRVLSRSLKYHRPRGLYCCTGSCAGCLVDVDGVPNVAACTMEARDGATVASQNTLGTARRDLLGAVDKVYARGFDPHGAFTKPALLNAIFLRAVRFMSGLGRAPQRVAPVVGKRRRRRVAHLVVGAGRHGLEAARRRARPGQATLVVDELPKAGGSALWDPTDDATRALVAEAGGWPDVDLWAGALAFGVYGPAVAVRRGDDLWEIEADTITIAPGRHDAWPLFANNDLPGVLSLRGAARLLHGHGVLPGRRVVGHGAPLPDVFVRALNAQGGSVVAHGHVEAARGGVAVEGAKVAGSWVDADTIVCNLPGTPRTELFQQAGCRLDFALGGLGPALDGDGQTSRRGLFAGFAAPPSAAGGR